jgi:hypothetical protein
MNNSKKINLVWIFCGGAALGFSIYEAAVKNQWGPLIGFAIGALIGVVFARKK